jgi:hypothetical protein
MTWLAELTTLLAGPMMPPAQRILLPQEAPAPCQEAVVLASRPALGNLVKIRRSHPQTGGGFSKS